MPGRFSVDALLEEVLNELENEDYLEEDPKVEKTYYGLRTYLPSYS